MNSQSLRTTIELKRNISIRSARGGECITLVMRVSLQNCGTVREIGKKYSAARCLTCSAERRDKDADKKDYDTDDHQKLYQ